VLETRRDGEQDPDGIFASLRVQSLAVVKERRQSQDNDNEGIPHNAHEEEPAGWTSISPCIQ